MTINNTSGVTPNNGNMPLESNNVVDLNARVSDASSAASVSSTQITAHDIDHFYQNIKSAPLTLQALTDELNNMTLDGKPLSLQQQEELISACLARVENDDGKASNLYSLLNEKFINVISLRGLMNQYMADIFNSKSGNPMIDDALEDDPKAGVW